MIAQPFHSLTHQGIEMDAATGQLCLYGSAHPFIPKFYQMVLDRRNGLLGILRLEKPADLIGHIGQLVILHGVPPVGRSGQDG